MIMDGHIIRNKILFLISFFYSFFTQYTIFFKSIIKKVPLDNLIDQIAFSLKNDYKVHKNFNQTKSKLNYFLKTNLIMNINVRHLFGYSK